MNVTIGKKIRSMRRSKDISQFDLAKKAQIAQSTLSYIENCKKNPQFETLSAICTALDVSMLELLTYEEPNIDFKLLEQGQTWQNILALERSGKSPMADFLNTELPPDAVKEICAFERYLFNKYSQIDGA